MDYHEPDEQELTTAVTAIADGGGLDWLEDSISLLSADGDLSGSYGWWCDPPLLPAQQDDIGIVVAQTLPPPAALTTTGSPPTSIASPAPASSKKRKSSPASGHSGGGSQRRRAEQERERPAGGGGKKKGGGSDCREARWAEQLLSPCAVAVEARNLSRVQHLFYVLGELASFSSGDANHRLAAYGLRALSLRLPAAVGPAAAAAVRVPALGAECPSSFAAAEPRVFRASLIRFHEVSPWFALPNALANAAIAQQLLQAPGRPLSLVDVGVSHGVQWPTLLESLTRLPAGRAPPSVRLTVVSAAAATRAAPFSASPPGYDFAPHLLRYAKSINLDLHIARAGDLSAQLGEEEALVVVCLQFRLGHVAPEERTEVLRKVRDLKPDLVVLSELDVVVGGGSAGAAGEFSARLELLWRFLESTSAAFKGRDGEDRRLMEAEAGAPAGMITAPASGEGREAWRDRMRAAGFQEAAFGGEAVESARSLLRKYDSGWEMAGAASGAAAVALRWKGQPVSFCSLWRPAPPP
ncbi:nodulation-signaling pathway 1 protein [Brachypodium distachyon]|nr:nodulation-signaling pathway 1 protein [Brachypodium distachyon]|eukprot:XP_014751807.1 nodulation-signaling pathway 1 protein [Brachypodium distachyon]